MSAKLTPPDLGGSAFERRRFLRRTLAFAAGAAGVASLGACGGGGGGAPVAAEAVSASTRVADGAVATAATSATAAERSALNLSLNLEYLSAQFYATAVGGVGVASPLLTGTGQRGAATGARRVTFTDPMVAQAASEIAADKLDHLSWLRSALGAGAAAQPAIDLSPAPTGAFSRLAQAAGLVAAGTAFDPYAGDDAFLLAAGMFEEAAAAGHRGALPSLSTPAVVDAATRLVASVDQHAYTIRALLTARAVVNPALTTSAVNIVKARSRLDGTAAQTDLTLQNALISTLSDEGDGYSPYSRTAAQVLDVFYLSSTAASSGGFFPGGVNGLAASVRA